MGTSDVNCVNLHLYNLIKLQDSIKDENDIEKNLKIVAVGLPGEHVEYTDPTDPSKHIFKTDVYKIWMDHYNKIFKLEGKNKFDPSQYEQYEKDVIKRASDGEIDLIISATKLSTGYDNPRENTIFIDRFFSLQGLLQAVARATRLFNSKEYANAVCYLPLKTTFDAAITLYNKNSDLSDHITWEAYDSAVNTFIHYVSETKKIAATPQYARDNIKEIENRKEFAKVFCSLYKQFKIIQSYIEYEFDEIKFGITEEEIADFKTVVSEWREEANETDPSGFFDTAEFDIINDLSFIEINATYIRKLIESIISIEAKSSKEKRAEEIRMQIKTSKNPFVIAQKDILLRGIDEALTCTTVEEYEKKLLKVIELMKNNDIKNFAEENKVSYNKMQELIDDLLINNNKNRISNFVEESLAERNSEPGIYKIKIKLKADIDKFLKMYRNKYIMCY